MIRALLLLFVTALPASAQLRLPLPPLPDHQIPAIGRLFNPQDPKGGFCTGTLVAPDLVLTAAHCTPVRASDLLFVFGDPEDPTSPRRAIASGTRHPTYVARGSHGPGGDLGFIRLARPIDIPPLPLAPERPATLPPALALIGFHGLFPFTRSGRLDCPVITRRLTYLQVGCPVIGGNSGSPILRPTATGWEILAVTSSTLGRTALAPELDDWARTLYQDHTAPDPNE